MTNYESLEIEIRTQQKGKENTPAFTIGEQLLDMARGNDEIAGILDCDLKIEGLALIDAEKMFQKYSDTNHKKQNVFCITPTVAEKLLKDFYKLPDIKPKNEEKQGDLLDLATFL